MAEETATRRMPLRMPKMSMTMETGELAGWRVAVGDVVAAGDVVCDVLTDKVDMEVESPATGTVVELVAAEGDTVPVGEPLAWLETESDSLLEDLLAPAPAAEPEAAPEPAAAEPAAPASEPEPAAEPVPEPASQPTWGRVPAIPQARRLAGQEGLDLAAVAGSGPGGAVMVSDVRAVLTDGRPALAVPGIGAAAAGDQQAVAPDGAWATRAAALAPRAGEAGAEAVWRDVVLGAERPPDGVVLARVVAGVSSALAALGPPDVRERPRVGIRVATAAGPVVVSVVGAHALGAADLEATVGSAVAQAQQGLVDVGLLAVPDAVVTLVPDCDRVLAAVRAPAALAVAVGGPGARVVAVGEGIGVRQVVGAGASGTGWAADPTVLGRILATLAAALAG